MGSGSSCPDDKSPELEGEINKQKLINDALSAKIGELENKEETYEKDITRFKNRIINDRLIKNGKSPSLTNAYVGIPPNNLPQQWLQEGGSRRTRRKVRKSGKPKKSRKNRSRK